MYSSKLLTLLKSHIVFEKEILFAIGNNLDYTKLYQIKQEKNFICKKIFCRPFNNTGLFVISISRSF